MNKVAKEYNLRPGDPAIIPQLNKGAAEFSYSSDRGFLPAFNFVCHGIGFNFKIRLQGHNDKI